MDKLKEYNLGYLNGQLETIARFNDKCDHVYDFNLSEIEKKKQY